MMSERTSKFEQSKADPARGGFTLIELVVVIGIAAILVSLIFSAVRSVRDRGERITCLSNLREIYAGVVLYAAENQGQLLAVDDPGWQNQYQQLELLGPYVGHNYRLFHCPTTSRKQDYFWNGAWLKMSATATIDGREEYTDYKLNDVSRKGSLMSRIPRPEWFVLCRDTDWAPEKRHGDGANFVFLDGSARLVAKEEMDAGDPYGMKKWYDWGMQK